MVAEARGEGRGGGGGGGPRGAARCLPKFGCIHHTLLYMLLYVCLPHVVHMNLL